MTPLWLSALFNVYRKKIDGLRVPGADVRPVPAVPYDNPENYNHIVSEFVNMSSIISEYDVLMSKYYSMQVKRFASSLSKAVCMDQSV